MFIVLFLLLANAPFMSVLFSAEVLHFDSGSLGLQQWNQWWVFVLVWHLHLAFPSLVCLSPPLTATSGRSRVEGQKRKFILPEPPALFHMVHWVCVCVCVKKLCWQVPVRRESRTGKRGGRRRSGDRADRGVGGADREKEVWRGRGGEESRGGHAAPLWKCFHLADDWWQVLPARVGVALSHCHWGVKHRVHPAAQPSAATSLQSQCGWSRPLSYAVP